MEHEWITVKLEDVCDIRAGIGFPKVYQGKCAGKYPFAKVGDISKAVLFNDSIISEAENYVDEEDLEILKGKPLPPESTVFAKIGEAIRLNRRAFAKQSILIDNNVMGLIPKKDIIDAHFLFYFMHTIELINLASATTVPSIRKSDVSNLKISLPSINQQKRIVTKIEELHAHSHRAREALETVPDLLEQLRQSILAAAFRGDLTRQWREQNPEAEPASELLKRIRIERRKRWEAAELDKLKAKGLTGDKLNAQFAKRRNQYKEPSLLTGPDAPDPKKIGEWQTNRWTIAPLELLSDPIVGIPYGIVQTGEPFPQGIPTVRGGDIRNYEIQIERLKLVNPSIASKYSRSKLHGGEVLIAIRGTVRATAVTSSEMKGMNVSREVAIVPLIGGVIPEYIMYLLSCPARQIIIQGQTKGVAQTGINLHDIRAFPVILPSTEEQIEIVNVLQTKLSNLSKFEKETNSLYEKIDLLNNLILSKAFRGELVPQAPNDEPASILLERIRQEKARQAAEQKTKPSQRGKKMKGRKIKQKDILTILQEAARAMTPEELFAAGGFGEDSVDAFYEQLRCAVIAKKVRETRKGADIRLEAML